MPDFGPPDELFHDTAWFYAQLPPALRRTWPNRHHSSASRSKDGSVIDLGCGTGQVAHSTGETWRAGMGCRSLPGDARPGTRRRCTRRTFNGIEWLQGSRPRLRRRCCRHSTSTCAQLAASFHWMDRERVAEALDGLMAPDGGIGIVCATASARGPRTLTGPRSAARSSSSSSATSGARVQRHLRGPAGATRSVSWRARRSTRSKRATSTRRAHAAHRRHRRTAAQLRLTPRRRCLATGSTRSARRCGAV